MRSNSLSSLSSDTCSAEPFSALSKLITVCDQSRSIGLRIRKMIFAPGITPWTCETMSCPRAE